MKSWAWPDSLDALTAAAGFHALLLENDDVRVLDTRTGAPLAPGSAVWSHALPPHTLENVSDAEIRVVGVEPERL